jgi:hypothetical protein
MGIGMVYSSACFGAVVGIESARLVGQSFVFSVFWSLDPPESAGATDIVAVFKVSTAAPPSSRRQLAWTYTSVPSIPNDYYGGGDPGLTPVPHGAVSLTIPSAGAGVYAVRYFRNSSNPYIPGLVPAGGTVLASELYYVLNDDGIIPPGIPASAQQLILDDPKIPSDLGIQVVNGGLVCPAGTVTQYPSNLADGGGYSISLSKKYSTWLHNSSLFPNICLQVYLLISPIESCTAHSHKRPRRDLGNKTYDII